MVWMALGGCDGITICMRASLSATLLTAQRNTNYYYTGVCDDGIESDQYD